jgi:hypothetical protein
MCCVLKPRTCVIILYTVTDAIPTYLYRHPLHCDRHHPLLPPPSSLLQGNWAIFGLVIKALKNQAKHEAAALALMRANGEVLRLLLGVARLLVRLPEQRKLLKVWILLMLSVTYSSRSKHSIPTHTPHI